MKGFIRWISGVRGPGISREEAVAIAFKYAQEKGWPWKEPISTSERAFDWFIMTNRASRGGNATFTIAWKGGGIKRADFIEF